MYLCLISVPSVQSFIKIGGGVLEKIEHMIHRDIHLLLLGFLTFQKFFNFFKDFQKLKIL